MMTNEERLLHALYGIKKVLNDFGLEDIKNEVQFKNGNTETIDCISVLQEFVVNYVNSTQPYKFEDLKPNMWVYDTKPSIEEFSFFKIEKILSEKDCGYLYQDKNKKVFIDNMTNHAREFEEGRYFPLTKAMEEFKNE